MKKAISTEEAYRILKARGFDEDCQNGFFAIDDDKHEIYEFDTKIERDNFVRRHKDGKENYRNV